MKTNRAVASTFTGVLQKATRLRNTLSGNARWKLQVDGYTFKTFSDSDPVCTADFSNLVGSVVKLWMTSSYKVLMFEVLPELRVGSIVYQPHHFDLVPVGATIQVIGPPFTEYTKLDEHTWAHGDVIVNAQWLFVAFRKLRVVRIGGQS